MILGNFLSKVVCWFLMEILVVFVWGWVFGNIVCIFLIILVILVLLCLLIMILVFLWVILIVIVLLIFLVELVINVNLFVKCKFI